MSRYRTTQGTVRIAKKGLREAAARSFETKMRGQIFQGFVIFKGGKYFAYQNLCQHLPITLDLNDENFFNHERQFLQCHMHGALYEVETGLCVGGPCLGAKLIALEFEERVSEIVIKIPDTFGKK